MGLKTFIASAPGRCGIVGNPSDIYGGTVVSCSMPNRAQCRITLGVEESSLPEDLRLWEATMKRFPLEGPVKVEWSTSIPRSSGLSGSTALLSATLASVLAARGEEPDLDDPIQLTKFAELVRDVERNDANIMCGYQDAYIIAHGGLQSMDFTGKHPVEAGPHAQMTPLDAPLPFLLITTGVERLSGSVHGPMAQRWMEGEQAVVKGISRIRELGQIGTEALPKHDWDTLADAMNENHRIIADLGGSGDAIDTLIGHCLQSGAKAAKLAGAGMGGTVIALTEDPDGLKSALTEHGYSRFLIPAITSGVRWE